MRKESRDLTLYDISGSYSFRVGRNFRNHLDYPLDAIPKKSLNIFSALCFSTSCINLPTTVLLQLLKSSSS